MKATLNYSSTIATRLASGLRREPSGCLVWTKTRVAFGYGRISRGSRGAGNASTHRVAWELENGPIPDGMHVLHHCDNPPCCEPSHLFLGTLSDNTQDMLSKGRAKGHIPSGTAHPSARLSDAEVEQLKAVAAWTGNYAEAGRQFGVSKQHARSLCLGHKRKAPAA